MSTDKMDKKYYEVNSKLVIGGLLQKACPLSKTVITAFDPMASRTANCSTLNKFKVESLEAVAVLLNISLVDDNSDKLFTKATLANRIVAELFALLPATCSECNDHYVVDFEPVEETLFTCYKCFQGSHSCDLMKNKQLC